MRLKMDNKNLTIIKKKYFETEIIPIIDKRFEMPLNLKVKAIFCLLYYTGICSKEIPFLRRADFNFKKSKLKIHLNKGRKIVKLNPRTKKAVLAYFKSELERQNAFSISYHALRWYFRELKVNFKNFELTPKLLQKSYVIRMVCRKKGYRDKNIVNICLATNLSIVTAYKYYDKYAPPLSWEEILKEDRRIEGEEEKNLATSKIF